MPFLMTLKTCNVSAPATSNVKFKLQTVVGQVVKPGLPINGKDRKHMFANMFFKVSMKSLASIL